MEDVAQSETPTVVVKRTIRADQKRVFDAWTKPELMAHWYVGGKGKSISTVDLRVGGKFINDMQIEDDVGGVKSILHSGEYLEIKPHEKLVFTWSSPFVSNTVVTVELRKVENGTEVVITHRLTKQEDCNGHTKGWTYALGGLASYLE